MKHLKRYNESVNQVRQFWPPSKVNSLEVRFVGAKISPVTDKLPISKIYDLLFIEIEEVIEGLDYEDGKFITIDLGYSSYTTVNVSLDDSISSIDEERFDVTEVRDSIVNLLEYNEINFQEIENILIDYNINVVNIWGLLR